MVTHEELKQEISSWNSLDDQVSRFNALVAGVALIIARDREELVANMFEIGEPACADIPYTRGREEGHVRFVTESGVMISDPAKVHKLENLDKYRDMTLEELRTTVEANYDISTAEVQTLGQNICRSMLSRLGISIRVPV